MPRQLSKTFLAQLGAAILVALTGYWFIQVGSMRSELLSRRECERAYQAAPTASDTLAVDEREPVLRRRDRAGVTCGSLRQAGQLSR